MPRRGLWALLAAAVLVSPQGARGEEPVDLLGTWHILIHYTDDSGHDPDAMRWEDHVWIMERRGSRLMWKKYPVVIFEDENGRFENLGTNHARRVMHGWNPDDGQLANIASGLQINSRGSGTKSLRGSPAKGFESSTRVANTSATTLSYRQRWSISGYREAPVFERQDVLGNTVSTAAEGYVRFETHEVLDGGDRLEGSYERDGIRHGTFIMRRAGPIRQAPGRKPREEGTPAGPPPSLPQL